MPKEGTGEERKKKQQAPSPLHPPRDNNEQDIVCRNFFTICLLPISKLHGLYGELRNGGKLVLSELGVVDNCWPMEGFEREKMGDERKQSIYKRVEIIINLWGERGRGEDS